MTFNLAYVHVIACQRKQSHSLYPGLSTLTIRPVCPKKDLNIVALKLFFDVVPTDEEEVVPRKLKKFA